MEEADGRSRHTRRILMDKEHVQGAAKKAKAP
jgi:hypothetical protein